MVNTRFSTSVHILAVLAASRDEAGDSDGGVVPSAEIAERVGSHPAAVRRADSAGRQFGDLALDFLGHQDPALLHDIAVFVIARLGGNIALLDHIAAGRIGQVNIDLVGPPVHHEVVVAGAGMPGAEAVADATVEVDGAAGPMVVETCERHEGSTPWAAEEPPARWPGRLVFGGVVGGLLALCGLAGRRSG